MQRQLQIESWLQTLYPDQPFKLAPASADASFRRYFRVTFDARPERQNSLIVMDAPPASEDCRPWLHVQQLFEAAGAHVPHVLAQDLERGFLVLSDLGNTTYLSALTAQPEIKVARHLYDDAIDALIRIQLASKPGVLPEYDHALLQRELMLFPDWYGPCPGARAVPSPRRRVARAGRARAECTTTTPVPRASSSSR